MDESESFNFDNLQEIDAEEYLLQVVKQARQLPHVVSGNNMTTFDSRDENRGRNDTKKAYYAERGHHIEGSIACLDFLMTRSKLSPAPSDRLPSVEWREDVIGNFVRLREYLTECKSHGIGGKSCRSPVPAMKDRAGWHIYCVGHSAAQGVAPSYYDDGDDDGGIDEKANDSSKVDKNVSPAWQEGLPDNGFEPTVSRVAQLDQVMVRRVLDHLIYYCTNGWPIPSLWLYALLSALEKPIHREDASMLYSLLKTCCQLRATSDVTRDEISRLNLLIVIVGVYFEQGGAECSRAL